MKQHLPEGTFRKRGPLPQLAGSEALKMEIFRPIGLIFRSLLGRNFFTNKDLGFLWPLKTFGFGSFKYHHQNYP